MTPSFASTFAMTQVSKLALLDSSKIVACTFFCLIFCLVFETGSGMKLTIIAKYTQ